MTRTTVVRAAGIGYGRASVEAPQWHPAHAPFQGRALDDGGFCSHMHITVTAGRMPITNAGLELSCNKKNGELPVAAVRAPVTLFVLFPDIKTTITIKVLEKNQPNA